MSININNMKTKKLQNQIFKLINGIESSEKAKSRFMQIIAVIYGRKSEAYKIFKELINTPEKQLEMLRAPENHKYKSNFMVFCHIVVEDCIEQTQPEPSDTSADTPLYGYFAEIEKTSQRKPSLNGFDRKSDIALNVEERNLTNFLLSPQAKDCLTAEDCRKILSIWLMYPEFIFHPDEIEKVIKIFRTEWLKA